MGGYVVSSTYITYSGGIVSITRAITGDIVITARLDKPLGPEINKDYTGASVGLIPVYYNVETKGWYKADVNNSNNSWYSYSGLRWANAVTVTQKSRNKYLDAPVDTFISSDDINGMWVWIPRYSYTIKQPYGNGGTSIDDPGEINIKFINTSTTETGSATYTGSTPNNWHTSDAFNFDGNALSGIWVAKFQLTGSLPSSVNCERVGPSCDVSKVTILPNESIMSSKSISTYFYIARTLQEMSSSVWGMIPYEDNLHVAKNDEYMAAVYLAHSYYGKVDNSTGINRLIYRNNNAYGKSGMCGDGPKSASALESLKYDDQNGVNASSTGNIYGVYDLNGPYFEYVMAAYGTDSPTISNSGFTSSTMPDSKYYNLYTSTDPKTACNGGVCYGHGLSETTGWYGGHKSFVSETSPWLYRNSFYTNAIYAPFSYSANQGFEGQPISCRMVISPIKR